MKERVKSNKQRVYEIYGIPKKDRCKYSIHHIVFKSDVKNGNGVWKGFDLDKKANYYPLPKEVHRELHEKVKETENGKNM